MQEEYAEISFIEFEKPRYPGEMSRFHVHAYEAEETPIGAQHKRVDFDTPLKVPKESKHRIQVNSNGNIFVNHDFRMTSLEVMCICNGLEFKKPTN